MTAIPPTAATGEEQTTSPRPSRAAVSPDRAREPRGFLFFYSIAYFGLNLATTAPLIGGLSIKVQHLVGVENAGTQLGLVTGIGALIALFAQPLAGRLSDRTRSRFGMRKPWILFGSIGAAIALLLTGIAPNIPGLIVAWCLVQLFANFVQAGETVVVADQVPEHRLGLISAVSGGAVALCSIVGASLLAILPNDMLRGAIPGLIVLICGVMFSIVLKDKVLQERPPRLSNREFFSSFYFNPRKYPDMGWAWLSRALMTFAYASVTTYLTLFLAVNFGMSDEQQLQFNVWAQLVSTVMILATALLAGRLSDKMGKRRVFSCWGGVVLGFGVMLIAPTPLLGPTLGLAGLLIAQACIGFGVGIFFSVDAAMVIEVLPDPRAAAKDLGVMNIAYVLPQTLAPFLAGFVFIPIGQFLFPSGGYPFFFLVVGAISVIGGLVAFKIKGVR